MKWVSAALQRHHARHVFSLLFLFLLHSTAAAQTLNSFSPPPNPHFFKPRSQSSTETGFTVDPVVLFTIITIFVAMVSCIVSICNRRSQPENQILPIVGGGAAGGLDPAVVESFPMFAYSEVKLHKIGKGALECAVCLSEFEGDDNLRLLPKCDHVFHPHCIDFWFAAHTTCPVCRTDFAAETGADAAAVVVITVNGDEEGPAEERSEEVQLLPPRSPGRRPRRIPRSQSAGQFVQLADDKERYTLRLPGVIRGDVVAGKFKRSATLPEKGARGREESAKA